MARKYYTLCVWDEAHGAWFDEFGDYSRDVVRGESDYHSALAKHKRIVVSDDTAEGMITARDALAAPKGADK